jgi:hypothetical protein
MLSYTFRGLYWLWAPWTFWRMQQRLLNNGWQGLSSLPSPPQSDILPNMGWLDQGFDARCIERFALGSKGVRIGRHRPRRHLGHVASVGGTLGSVW